MTREEIIKRQNEIAKRLTEIHTDNLKLSKSTQEPIGEPINWTDHEAQIEKNNLERTALREELKRLQTQTPDD